MPGYRLTEDAPTTTGGSDAKRLGTGAVALLALGAPFVAAAPAAAENGGAGQPGNGHAEAQATAQIATDASASGDSGAVAAAGADSPAGGRSSAHAPPSADDAGAAGSSAGTRAGGEVHARARGGAAGGEARHHRGAETQAPHAARAHVHSGVDAHGRENGAASRADGNSQETANAHAPAQAAPQRHGDRGFTKVRLTPGDERAAGGRGTAMVKASPALDAAIRAEARAAAREEVHARLPRLETDAKRIAVKRRVEGTGQRVRVRQPTTAEDAEALLRILERTWSTGGAARANAMLALCVGRGPSDLQAPLTALREDDQRGGGNARRSARSGNSAEIAATAGARGRGRAQLAPGRSERASAPGRTERANAPGRSEGAKAGLATGQTTEVDSPRATANRGPGSAVTPHTNGTVQAPTQAGGAPLQQDAASRPAVRTGPSTPTEVAVRRESGAALQQGQLPFTGSQLPLLIFAGTAAIAAGALLRRKTMER